MSIDDFDPLNKDERLLASKLGFSKRDFAPSASVEESIRAEARRAELHSPSRVRAATGWLKYGGIAAACVLAFGVAWKTMRTSHPNEIDAMRAPVATGVEAKTPAMDTSQAEPIAAESSNADAPAAVIEAPPTVHNEVLEAPVATPIPTRPAPVAEATSAPAHGVVAAAASSVQTQMEPAAAVSAEAQTTQAASKQRALPAAAPPAADVQDSARRANEAAANPPRSMPSKAAPPAPVQVANPSAATPFASKPAAADSAGAIENGYDARPPKTTDAQDVQQAWLKRIRSLALAGKQEEAAASLEAWHKRYPDATIPADLLPLRKVIPNP